MWIGVIDGNVALNVGYVRMVRYVAPVAYLAFHQTS